MVQDFGTPLGNLEHIVVAQTGLFFIETKLWRGVVTPDGNGELLLNGTAPLTPAVKPFVSRAMVVKEEIEALCGFPISDAKVGAVGEAFATLMKAEHLSGK